MIETGIWLIITTIITIWATRILLHSICALHLGTIRERKTAKTARAPMVTVFLPTYNEHKVIDRLLESATNIDYPNLEIIVADDSTDAITLPALRRWEGRRNVKVVHRSERSGYKAGALNNAIKHANPRSQYFAVFDADYVIRPDTIWRMVDRISEVDAAVVQGYASNAINAAENLLTKGVSVTTASYSLVDIAVRSRLNGFVPIFGTVFMIRRDALKRVGGFNERSITEDWDLASKLTQHGYRIVFDDGIKASGECPSTLPSLIRQQMRWIEGIVRDTRHNMRGILTSKKASLLKKFDYVFYGLSPFNSILGFISYLIAFSAFLVEIGAISAPGVDHGLVTWFGQYGTYTLYIAPVYIPAVLIFASVVALYREGRLGQIHWSIYSIAINTMLVPFTAFASFRGLFFEKGSWSRTPKTGRVIEPSLPGV